MSEQPAPERPESEERWSEKEEKYTGEKSTGEKDTGEKEHEKQHEKEEKPSDMAEKWRRDPLSAIVLAASLIIGGFVLILDNLGVLFFRGNGWAITLVCAGLIVALGALVRTVMPEYRRPLRGSLILAAILFGLGLSGWIGWGVTWAIVIIGAGIAILWTGLRRGS
jgi:uncharacterized membrane protein YcjF (UPF0283 family)